MDICVFGAASDLIDKSYIDATEKLGEIMAKRGHNLVFGAGFNGLMGAIARGIHTGGGSVWGIIPKFFKTQTVEQIYSNADKIVFTETMAERKTMMEDLSEAFIIVPGGIGTFEEFFQVLTLKQLGRHTKPIAIYNINGYYDQLKTFMQAAIDKKFVKDKCNELFQYFDDPVKLLEYIENTTRIEYDVHDLKNG